MSEQPVSPIQITPRKPKLPNVSTNCTETIIRAFFVSTAISYFYVTGKLLSIAFKSHNYDLVINVISVAGWQFVFLFACLAISLALKVTSFFASK